MLLQPRDRCSEALRADRHAPGLRGKARMLVDGRMDERMDRCPMVQRINQSFAGQMKRHGARKTEESEEEHDEVASVAAVAGARKRRKTTTDGGASAAAREAVATTTTDRHRPSRPPATAYSCDDDDDNVDAVFCSDLAEMTLGHCLRVLPRRVHAASTTMLIKTMVTTSTTTTTATTPTTATTVTTTRTTRVTTTRQDPPIQPRRGEATLSPLAEEGVEPPRGGEGAGWGMRRRGTGGGEQSHLGGGSSVAQEDEGGGQGQGGQKSSPSQPHSKQQQQRQPPPPQGGGRQEANNTTEDEAYRRNRARWRRALATHGQDLKKGVLSGYRHQLPSGGLSVVWVGGLDSPFVCLFVLEGSWRGCQ